jgi:Ni,Fe-hydrogenase III small subunit/formate hydrogenlyase subunit 6/NADH:ubiquinone oxidoreductase subunit I
MFDILRKSFATGVVTTSFPQEPWPTGDTGGRGRPRIDFDAWKDARPACAACPTGALVYSDTAERRRVVLDLGKCTFCGLCAEADASIQMSSECLLAAQQREGLVTSVEYELTASGIHARCIEPPAGKGRDRSEPASPNEKAAVDEVGRRLERQVKKMLGRSLHIREVDAGSCNGCEVEIVGLNSPIYDVERFGIHFVASPRHADMLLVTGPVSRNMELALKKTYEAMPAPRLVVAAGACACSGGIFGQNYASLGGVDKVVPVDVYIPGCPPNPYALLQGILLAIGKWEGSGGHPQK